MFYQRLPWFQTNSFYELAFGLNLWGELPEAIGNPHCRPVVFIDIGGFQVGHTGVPYWYLSYIL